MTYAPNKYEVAGSQFVDDDVDTKVVNTAVPHAVVAPGVVEKVGGVLVVTPDVVQSRAIEVGPGAMQTMNPFGP